MKKKKWAKARVVVGQ